MNYSNYQSYHPYNQENYHPNPPRQLPHQTKYLDNFLGDYDFDDNSDYPYQVNNENYSGYEADQYKEYGDFEQKKVEEPRENYDEVKVLCTYCNQSYPLHSFTEHEEQCDMKKITCEKCGKKVLIEVFDTHELECSSTRTNQRENPRQNSYSHIIPRVDTGLNRGPYGYNLRTNRNQPGRGTQQNQQNRVPSIGTRRNYTNRLPLYDPISHIDQFDFLDPQPDAEISENATYEDLLELDNNIVKKGLTKTQLEKFRARTFITSTESTQPCSICMTDFEMGEKLRKLKCGHEFHMSCIDTWLKENITCPVCKKELR